MEQINLDLHDAVLYPNEHMVTFNTRHFLGNIFYACLALNGFSFVDFSPKRRPVEEITTRMLYNAIFGKHTEDPLSFLHDLTKALPDIAPTFRVETHDTLVYRNGEEERFVEFHERHYIGHVIALYAARHNFDANTFVTATGEPTPQLSKFLKQKKSTKHAHNITQGSREDGKNKETLIPRF